MHAHRLRVEVFAEPMWLNPRDARRLFGGLGELGIGGGETYAALVGTADSPRQHPLRGCSLATVSLVLRFGPAATAEPDRASDSNAKPRARWPSAVRPRVDDSDPASVEVGDVARGHLGTT